MAKFVAWTVPSYPPAFIAEPIGSGTDHLIAAGLPVDPTNIVADPATGFKNIAAGAVINRSYANRNLGLPFLVWDGVVPLEEFYIVPFSVTDLVGREAACNGLRWQTLIYEDRLPASFQALTETLKLQFRAKYQMILARKVAL